MTQPALSLALSLGEVDLKSHLGEPLIARISINDTDPAIDVGCFTVADNSETQAFRKASTTLNQNNNGLTLAITTSQVISEPIINLSVTYHCEPRVNREYVLLLDPAPISDTAKLNTNNQPSSDLTANQRQNASNQAKAELAANKPVIAEEAAANVEPPIKKPRAKKKKVKKPIVSVEQKLAEAYTGTPQTTSPQNNQSTPSAPAQPATSEKPYLVISGGNSNAGENGNPNLALRMETELDLNRTEAAPPLSSTETMDEVTVMANRLAHLEKQILSLQTQNQQLQAVAAAEKAKNDSTFIPPALAEWLPYVGLGALLLLAVAGIEAWRRKLMRERLERHEAAWFDAATDEALDADTSVASDTPRVEPKFSSDPLFAELATQQASIVTDTDTDEIEGVLEHAEVFIAHGRTVLAIQLLQNHLTDFPNQSPTIWLKLLSLLANEGLETEYDVAVIECNQFFNIKLPSFADANVPDDSSIEDHPHIVDRLEGAWGSPYAITLLNDLIYNQHSQPREGFARGTFEELFFLKKIAEALQSSDVLENRANLTKAKSVQSNIAQIAPSVAATAALDAAPEASPGFTVTDSMELATAEDIEQTDSVLTDSYSSTDFEDQLLALKTQQTQAPKFTEATEENIEEIQFQAAKGASPELTFVSSAENFNADDFNTGNSEDFQVSELEIDFPLEVEELSAPEIPAPNVTHLDEMTFTDDFAEALEFDQGELKSLPEAEPENPEDDTKKKDSNVIEFEWDLPKINKD